LPNQVIETSHGILIPFDQNRSDDLDFCREVFGFEALKHGWFRERDRLYFFPPKFSLEQARVEIKQPPPPSILDVPAPPLPDGPVSRHLLDMPDGTRVTWINHPAALPAACQPHWRAHTHLFEVENSTLGFTAYTSIFGYAHLEGADARFRIFGPGGIRWIDYPSKEAALNDALDMSLAVAMKIQVVGTPCAGNKIAVYGDYENVGPVLRALFTVYERMGIVITSADLGLSIAQLEAWALPVAPTCLVPLGVYCQGIPSAVITADASFAGLQAMAEALDGSPDLGDLTISQQGIGEVGYRMAHLLLKAGTRLILTEADADTRRRFQNEHQSAFASGQARMLEDLDAIYDAKADLFVPCALRDILSAENLTRLKEAGLKMVGGPANNLFPDQVEGPWQYHAAGLPVVPYEGIGAGGVTGVAYSIMSGIYGRAPFDPADKVQTIRDYVGRVMRWSQAYDLPAQVVSDRILFNRARRRRILSQAQSDRILERMRQAFKSGDHQFERDVINDLTKRGLFYGPGRMASGGWRYLEG
jgi:hypothetical protein